MYQFVQFVTIYYNLIVLRKYFKTICSVEEPESHFNVDQYTDLTRVTKPVICISLAEIIDTHKVRHTAHMAWGVGEDTHKVEHTSHQWIGVGGCWMLGKIHTRWDEGWGGVER